MKKTLALCLITNDTDVDKAVALANSFRGIVDHAYITTTGVINIDGDEYLKSSEFTWCDDFSAARNFNFSQAKEDWILWLDADDELQNPENLANLIQQAELAKVSGYFFNYKYAFDKDGNCTHEHWKAQLLKNDGHFEWKGAIHEDPLQLRPSRWVRTLDCIRIHKSDNAAEKSERNLRILLKEREKNPTEPRNLFYLGRTYIALEKYQECIDVLQEYLKLSGWDDERYEACIIIGQCFIKTGDLDTAILVFNQAILEKESNPDAYFQKGVCYMQKEKYNDALWNFKTALERPLPEGATFKNPTIYNRDIYAGIANCYMHLGELENAYKAINKALQASPTNVDFLEFRKFIRQEIAKYSVAQKYVEIAKYIEKPSLVEPLIHSIPPSLSDNEMILGLRNSFIKPKEWEDKTIAVYCGASAETWSPESLNKGGIGGSETAVIELSKRLQAKGYKVTVFNQCDAPPEGMTFDGVEYQNYWKFNIKDEFNILWVWRLPELFDYDLQAKFKFLDLHDTMTPHDFPSERLDKIDKIFVKTEYHRSLYPAVPDSKFVVINNGIDLKRFETDICSSCKNNTDLDQAYIKEDGTIEYYNCLVCNDEIVSNPHPGKFYREPFRFIYTSSPNRGLDVLLKMWPRIKEKLKDAELHVYYGWNTFYKLEKGNPERMLWMKKVQELLKQDGVVEHGRIDQKTLAEEMLKSSYWLYPTDFPEISCITAMEMQAAGVLPITTGYAALGETQVVGVKVPGDTSDPLWKDEYIGKVIESTELQYPVEEIKKAAEQFSWDLITERWINALK